MKRFSLLFSGFLLLLLVSGATVSCGSDGGSPPPGSDVADAGDAAGDALADGVMPDGQDAAADPGSDPAGPADGAADGLPEESLTDAPGDADVVCVPDCAGKQCGADGCGGSCGSCPQYSQCDAGGVCQAPACASSKDCPLELVCDKFQGICVECVEDADCGEGKKCNAQSQCFDVTPCGSDKDCKDVGGVCDKAEGICVDCLADTDCGEEQVCVASTCLDVICAPGDLLCVGHSVSECDGTGTQYVWSKDCLDSEYCTGGQCVPLACEPDSTFCQGKVAIACNSDGTGFASTSDCGASGLACQDGECVPCAADCAGKVCGDDGCGGSCGECDGGLSCIAGACGTPCQSAAFAKSRVGCEFWAADLDNVEVAQNAAVGVQVMVPGGNGPATLTFIDYLGGVPKQLLPGDLGAVSLVVPEGTAQAFKLPASHDLDGSELSYKAIRILSDVPVSVVQLNPLKAGALYSADGSLLLPAHLAGTKYFVFSWKHRAEGFVFSGNLAVVGTQDGTSLSVWPTAAVAPSSTVPALPANPMLPYTFMLNAGTTLNLATSGPGGADLTGSMLESDKPVVVFGAHECANIPLEVNYCDHIEEQLPPLVLWRTEYVGDVFKPRNAAHKDIWRIMASEDGTTVTLDPLVAGPYSLSAGQWVEFLAGEAFHVKATKPILLGHYLQGGNYSGFASDPLCGQGSTGIGDPAFSLPTGIVDYATQSRLFAPPDYEYDYVNIVLPASKVPSLKMDGEPLAAGGTAVGTSGLALVQVSVTDGYHEVLADAPLGLTSYGYACDMSYAYPGP